MRSRVLVGSALASVLFVAVWLGGDGAREGRSKLPVAPMGRLVAEPRGEAGVALWAGPEAGAVESAAGSGEAGLVDKRQRRLMANATRIQMMATRGGATPHAAREGAEVILPLGDGARLIGVVNRVADEEGGTRVVSGHLSDGGVFALTSAADVVTEGLILPASGETVYRVAAAGNGAVLLAEVPRGDVLCATLPRPPANRSGAAAHRSTAALATAESVVVPILNSLPDVEAVMFLDFDGESVNDPVWNGGATIEAASSGLSEAEIRRAWRMVAEDYRAFRVNITTDPARYAAARPKQRMRCIITPTRAWYGEVGGVALVYSWKDAGMGPFAGNVPCWVFSEPGVMTAEDVALAVSHEIGHTLGLYHDGLRNEDGITPPEGDYYAGHGAGQTAWGPIMGAPYGKPLIQWSRGDYAVGLRVANNPEDDIALIANIENHVGFVSERRGESLANAERLAVEADGVTVDHRGVITRAGAEAWLVFATGAGEVSLGLAPEHPDVADATNLDGALTLTRLDGTVLASVDTVGTRFPVLGASLAAGIYVLRVKSVGEGSPTNGGYSDYGSIGGYRIVGNVNAPVGVAPRIVGPESVIGRVGESFSYTVEVAGDTLTYTAGNLPPGLSLVADGVIVGVPEQAGVWNVTLRATNSVASSERTMPFVIGGATLAQTLDAPTLEFHTGGGREWIMVASLDAPVGGAAARTGELLDEKTDTWIETTVKGPARLRWLWRVSSEKNYDILHCAVDGVTVAAISGELPWMEQSIEIPAGEHTVRWSYDKDDYISEGEDAGWLGHVRLERGFEQWTETAQLVGPAGEAEADPDGDGVPNLLEYGLGLDPRVNDGLGQSVRVVNVLRPSSGGGVADVHLELTFIRPPAIEDVRYVVEVTSDLRTWQRGHAYGPGTDNSAPDLPTMESGRVSLPDGYEEVSVRDRAKIGQSGGARFIRLRIERN